MPEEHYGASILCVGVTECRDGCAFARYSRMELEVEVEGKRRYGDHGHPGFPAPLVLAIRRIRHRREYEIGGW